MADHERLDVRKFRGKAGRDRKALVAALIVGELAPTAGLQVPDIFDVGLARAVAGPDAQDQELRRAIHALNRSFPPRVVPFGN